MQDDSQRSLLGASSLASEVRALPEAARHALGITSEAITIWDAIVSAFAFMINDEDDRPPKERINVLFNAIPGIDLKGGNVDQAALDKWTGEFQNTLARDIPKWSHEVGKFGTQRFLLRLFGARAYRKCLLALQHDVAIVTVAVRRATRALLPYVSALDDLYGVLPAEATRKLSGASSQPLALLQLALKMDEAFGEKSIEWKLPLAISGARDAELESLGGTDVAEFTAQLRDIVSGRARQSVESLDATLARKIRGARDALLYSSDPVAQASNSLIELLDRILRAAFDDQEVLDWSKANYPDLPDMRYAPDSNKPEKVRPTKKAQALCLVHGGADISEPSVLHELAALAIVATRNELQKVKHADRGGTPDEMAAIESHLAAIEAYLLFAIELAWAAVPADRVEKFHKRLG